MTKSTHSADYQQLKQDYALMTKKFPNNSQVAEHHHRKHQLLFATQGLMQLKIASDIWLIPNNKAILIPAKTRHSIMMLSKVTMQTLYIEPSAYQKEIKLKVIAVSRLMRELIIALAQEPLCYSTGSRAAQIANLIALELTAAKNEPILISQPKDSRLIKICNYLLTHPADNKTLNEWGNTCGASERTLSRLFAAELGENFRQWRQKVRLMHAIKLLNDNKSIKHIARDCGYSSLSAFNTAFISQFSCSPSIYIKRLIS
ncbi:transcriptional regulator [Thalassotalea insulae]|uniref:Transcriptional regulator n=1 Tax=Thalassotalea insulae TaxID=2056778 RepID=A0ABQ6GS86_9GAMM|nr:helix-turn-helix transcriptional regulator [Thalassotalea insulae]GLX78262.1 transcriptional regulator [Thalassotalea insulae]